MSDEPKVTVSAECEDKELHLHLHNVLVGDNSVLKLCCPCCGGSSSGDGNGGGNGNGNGGGNGNGNGNGNGDGDGDGNGNGGGDGGDGPGDGDGGGNDDDKPGDLNIALLGSTKNDGFFELLRDEDGYTVQGQTLNKAASYRAEILLAKYKKDLSLVSQARYVGTYHLPHHITGPRLFKDPENNRYYYGTDRYYSNGSTELADGLIVAVEGDTWKASAVTKFSSASGANDYPAHLIPAPVGFTGPASMLAIVGTVYVMAFDSDTNMLNSIKVSAPSKTTHLRNVHATKNKVLALGSGTGNFTTTVAGGLLVVMNDILQQEAIYAYGYEKAMCFHHALRTKHGLVIAGQVTNKENGKNDIIMLELDDSYAVSKRAMLSVGAGDDLVTWVDSDASGNILLCGTTNSVGAGSTDVFLVRLDPDFNVTKELVFGSAAAESSPAALFNADGSVTFVGTTAGAGAGGTDAFIATVGGDWSELTGSLKKYPAMRINSKPGFKVDKDFKLEFNDKTTYTVAVGSFSEGPYTITTDTDPGLIVDPNAVVEI